VINALEQEQTSAHTVSMDIRCKLSRVSPLVAAITYMTPMTTHARKLDISMNTLASQGHITLTLFRLALPLVCNVLLATIVQD